MRVQPCPKPFRPEHSLTERLRLGQSLNEQVPQLVPQTGSIPQDRPAQSGAQAQRPSAEHPQPPGQVLGGSEKLFTL